MKIEELETTEDKHLHQYKEMDGWNQELEKLRKMSIKLDEREISDYSEALRHKTIFNMSPLAIFIVHIESDKIVGCNLLACKLLGKKKNEIEGKLFEGEIKGLKKREQWVKAIKPNGQRFKIVWVLSDGY